MDEGVKKCSNVGKGVQNVGGWIRKYTMQECGWGSTECRRMNEGVQNVGVWLGECTM